MTRTILVVLSIAVGVFAVGTMTGAREIMLGDLHAQYVVTNDRSLFVNAFPIDDAFVRSVRAMPEVAEVDGRGSVFWPLYVGERRRTTWLQVVGDFDNIAVNTWTYVSGKSVPGLREMLMERSTAAILGVDVGSIVELELPDGKRREILVAGLVHDINAPPVNFTSLAVAYLSLDTWEWLGNPRTYNSMRVVVAEDKTDYTHVRAVGELIKKRAQDQGLRWNGLGIQNQPSRHFGEDPLSAISTVLSVIGALALFLSAFLVINTINAVMAQQVRQIGIMKAIGANARQIATLYLVMVLVYGVLGLLVGVPLGILGAQGFARFIGGLLNFSIISVLAPPWVLWLQVAIGLLVPVCVALVPVINGTRLPARYAIYNNGLESTRKQTPAQLARAGGVNNLFSNLPLRPLLISLRNTFRRRARVSLTLATLTLASAMFIGIFSVRDSLNAALAQSISLLNYDVFVQLARSQTDTTLEREALAIPGVVAAEAWAREGTRLVDDNGKEDLEIRVEGVPALTQRLKPELTAGRWLQPGDTNAIVVNNYVQDRVPGLQLDEVITLKHGNRLIKWRIVGFMKDAVASPVGLPNAVYANLPGYRATLGLGRQAQLVVLSTSEHDGEAQQRIGRLVEEKFKRGNIPVGQWNTTVDRANETRTQLN